MADARLTDAQAFQVAMDVREGVADPAQARALLEMFVSQVSDQNIPSPDPVLLKHVAACLDDALSGRRSTDAAFGLVRRKGRPARSDRHGSHGELPLDVSMATSVIKHRLDLLDHQSALEAVAERFGYSSAIVGEAFSRHRTTALQLALTERGGLTALSPVQRQVVERIVANQPDPAQLIEK